MLFNSCRINEEAISLNINDIERTQFRARPLIQRSNFHKLLEYVTCPILAVIGKEDPFQWNRLDIHRELLETAAKQVCIKLVPRSAHWVCFDRPNITNKLIIDFLSDFS